MVSLKIKDVFSLAHTRIKLRYPDIKPLRFIERDEDDPKICAYEDDETIAIAIERCLEFYKGEITSQQIATGCVSLLAHEIIGHDKKYGVIKSPAKIVLEQSTDDSESVPYHVQFALMGNKECMQKVKDHSVWLMYIVQIMLKVRDEVTRYLNERNPRKCWARQNA